MITQGVAVDYKKDMFDGIVHSSSDTYKIALYVSLADISPQSKKYTTSNEVSAKGYDQGGKVITGFKSSIDGDSAVLKFDNAVWNNASIKASGFMIYNHSKEDKAVFIGSFDGEIVSTNDTFIVEIPAEGLMRL